MVSVRRIGALRGILRTADWCRHRCVYGLVLVTPSDEGNNSRSDDTTLSVIGVPIGTGLALPDAVVRAAALCAVALAAALCPVMPAVGLC
jgi:hypothetical protein